MLTNDQRILRSLPPKLAVTAKAVLAYPRYYRCLIRCRIGFRRVGHLYRHPILFIAALPKSGSTWLENMISSFEGYGQLLIPCATYDELRKGDGHRFQLPSGVFQRMRKALVLTKMHIPGSKSNVEILDAANIPYVVLVRDLRDVAVSHYHYVRNTPWHGDYSALSKETPKFGIRHFAENHLSDFVGWMESWAANRNRSRSVLIRYEDLLQDGESTLPLALRLFGLPSDDSTVNQLIASHSMSAIRRNQRISGGSNQVFFRKGIAGDWKTEFDAELKAIFKEIAGQTLIDFGYEASLDW